MAKFIFNMQGLLNIKEKLEEQAKTEYGKALNKLEEEKNILLNLENKKQENILSFRESINKGVKPNYINSINQYISLIEKKIEAQIETVNKTKDFVEERRVILLNSMKERKVLEALKEKEKENYFKEEIKKEQKIIDEIVSYKYNEA